MPRRIAQKRLRRASGIPDDTGGGGTPRVKVADRHGSGAGNTFIGAMPGDRAQNDLRGTLIA
jgi:hypothetical protein